MPNGIYQSLLPRTRQTVRNAEMLGELDAGGFMNRFGGNLGTIGRTAVNLPPVGAWASNPANTRRVYGNSAIRLPGGGMRTGPAIGAGLPSVADMRQAEANDLAARQAMQQQRMAQMRATKSGLFEPMNRFRDRIDARNYSGGNQMEMDRVAINRLRQGMRLNPQEQGTIDRLAGESGGLGTLLAGSSVERKTAARQRVMEQAQTRRAERQLRMALRRGTPEAFAMLERMPENGGALTDLILYGRQGAAALAGQRATAQSELGNIMARGEQERLGNQQLLDSQNPASVPNGVPAEGEVFTPTEQTMLSQMTPEEIQAEAVAKKWPAWKTRAAMNEFAAEGMLDNLPQAFTAGARSIFGPLLGMTPYDAPPALVRGVPRSVRQQLQRLPPDQRIPALRTGAAYRMGQ